MTSWEIIEGDCRDTLATLPDRSVQTVVTSPPYFGLRDYGTTTWEGGDPDHEHDRRGARNGRGGSGTLDKRSANAMAATVPVDVCSCGAVKRDAQIGLEPSPDEFVAALVEVFRGVRRVLRDDGTVWLNLGDSYAGSWGNQGRKSERGSQRPINGEMLTPVLDGRYPDAGRNTGAIPPGADYKAKDLLGIPWLVAFALRADGWYLRSDIIWAKPNPMPESVTDRPTKAHEYVFLLSKGPRYYFDANAIREGSDWGRENNPDWQYQRAATNETKHPTNRNGKSGGFAEWQPEQGRNKRSVWTVATQPYPGAHFATFPPKLIEPCILAGSSPRACGECGAPWRRVVERTAIRDRWEGGPRDGAKLAGRQEQGLTSKRTGLSASNSHNASTPQSPEVRTVGWEPTCEHTDDTGSSVVLDPFAGAGTTGVVARLLGRDFIGCELNPAYAQMARDRIEVEGRPGNRRHEAARVADGQLDIFAAFDAE